MNIGLVGYQGSGKSTLFEWLTGVPADPALAHTTQAAMVPVPDPRMEQLTAVYHPKKVVHAAIELVDTPGLARSHEGSAQRLGLIRNAGCLVVVVEAFRRTDPRADLASFEEDVLLADLEIVLGRIERLREQARKPRPGREQDQAQIEALQPVADALESGRPLREIPLTDEQQRAIKSFQLITHKPRLVVLNVADDEAHPERFAARLAGEYDVFAAPLGLELELARMSPADRAEFEAEMGLTGADRGTLIRKMLDASGQMLFFTASEKEVRSWLIPRGTTAVEAAGHIHTDLARGFIRAETMSVADLVRLGSEREVKAAGLMRQEPKDYVVREGDILHVKFSV